MVNKKSKIQFFRHLIQIAFFFVYPGLFTLTFSQIKQIYQLLIRGDYNILPILPQCVEALILLPFTLILGRFFCGWFCAFGAFNDYIYMLSQKICRKKITLNSRLNSVLKTLKYGVLIFIIDYMWTQGSRLFAGASPWDAFAQLSQISDVIAQFKIGSIILLLIIIGAAFIERFFCRYLCPLGAIFAILSKTRILSIDKPREKCSKCKVCTNNCPMGIQLDQYNQVNSGECINCFRCTSVCPRKNTRAAILQQHISPTFSSMVVIAVFIGLYSVGSRISNNLQANSSYTIKSNTTLSSSGDSPSNRSNLSNNDSIVPNDSNHSADTTPGGNSENSPIGQYKDGTYTGVGFGHRSGLNVSVTIKNQKISAIEILGNRETPRYANRVFNILPDEIVQAQSTQVDAVSGATETSDGILQAVQDALSNAAV